MMKVILICIGVVLVMATSFAAVEISRSPKAISEEVESRGERRKRLRGK